MDRDSKKIEFEELLIQYEKERALAQFELYIQKHGFSEFVDNILVDVLESIGTRWEKGELSLSQVYLSSRICEELIAKGIPNITMSYKNTPKMAIVTLEDHHVLGKRIVSAMLRSSGFLLMDYGHGVMAEDLVEKVIQDKTQILLISVLMYPSALKVKKVRELLCKANVDIKILVGGAPFMMDQELWQRVGANAMGKNAAEDISIVGKWIQEGQDI